MRQDRLRRLYGNRAAEAWRGIQSVLDRWRVPVADALGRAPPRPTLDQRDVILIAYPDHLLRGDEAPLATLSAWCRAHLRELVSAVHVLPFHPSTSYEGYAITDYMAVDPRLGSWSDLEALAGDFALMVDLVLNHCSASHPWFQQLLDDEEPGRRYFIGLDDPEQPWLQRVRRARNLPLLHPFETRAGTRHIWTTYSPDLVDLDWREVDVCLEFLEILLDAVVRGARLVRLDAHVYTWKAPGTDCVALPETHELVRLFQDVLDAVGADAVRILPSITNVTQQQNFGYLAPADGAREADLVYHLPLSALLLLTLYRGDASVLARWLDELPPAPEGRAYLNLAATHDGIGLSWLEGLLPEEDIRALVAEASARGALLSSRRPTASGADAPWEINATWFSACAPRDGGQDAHVAGFLATQSVVLALRGVPALYLSLFVAGENDHERVARSSDNRAINRGRFDLAAWEAAVARDGSAQAAVLAGLQALLRARRGCAAFHPDGAQRVLRVEPAAVLALERTAPGHAPGGAASVLCLASFASHPVRLSGAEICQGRSAAADGGSSWQDLLGDETGAWSAGVEIAPYQVRWLVPR